MQRGQRAAEGGTMERLDPARPHPGEKRHDRRRPTAQLAQCRAVTPVHGGRAGHAMPGEMLHQRDKKGQVLGIDPLFIERQDEIAAPRW